MPVEEKKKDWVPAVAVGAGGAAIIAGLVFFMRRGEGIKPGGDFTVQFTFDYLGPGGTYVLQVHLGKVLLLLGFDHVEGLGWSLEVNLPGPDHYTYKLDCKIPMGTPAKSYDGEAGIRLPGPWDPPYNYIAGPLYQKGAIKVLKE